MFNKTSFLIEKEQEGVPLTKSLIQFNSVMNGLKRAARDVCLVSNHDRLTPAPAHEPENPLKVLRTKKENEKQRSLVKHFWALKFYWNSITNITLWLANFKIQPIRDLNSLLRPICILRAWVKLWKENDTINPIRAVSQHPKSQILLQRSSWLLFN